MVPPPPATSPTSGAVSGAAAMSASVSIPSGAGPPTTMTCRTFSSSPRSAANMGACS